MFNFGEAQKEHTTYIRRIEGEVEKIYSTFVLPHWGDELHGFTETLYGYMMSVVARIDLLSAYWKGNTATRGQTRRMVEFMDTYVSQNHEANSVAVKTWRHLLMHTSRPRQVRDERTGKVYRWLPHWGEHLPPDQHYTFTETIDSKTLNLGLIYLIGDLKKGIEKYLVDLSVEPLLQSNYDRVQLELAAYTFKIES